VKGVAHCQTLGQQCQDGTPTLSYQGGLQPEKQFEERSMKRKNEATLNCHDLAHLFVPCALVVRGIMVADRAKAPLVENKTDSIGGRTKDRVASDLREQMRLNAAATPSR